MAAAFPKCFSFYVQVFYVMGKALTGLLSCSVTGLVFLISQQYVVNSDYYYLDEMVLMRGDNICFFSLPVLKYRQLLLSS